jgi:hypothetical protein
MSFFASIFEVESGCLFMSMMLLVGGLCDGTAR